jgi:predicted unusual protein kinase regulating ubiquinone biosynthesis (AarF/ABC1/UbiB family)
LRQLLEFGFFHADPHPGNLFAMPDGRMAFIDFGMMDQLEQEVKETLVDSVVHLINRDYNDLAKDFVKLGFLTPDTDILPIVPALE